VDIIFAYAYNQRTTLEEVTCESNWTICRLSATLSWFESFANVNEVAIACLRRSLVYPLYRHWALSQKVWTDTLTLFALGKRSVLRCLLHIKHILDHSDPRFYLSRLYIDDYCIWIQSVK